MSAARALLGTARPASPVTVFQLGLSCCPLPASLLQGLAAPARHFPPRASAAPKNLPACPAPSGSGIGSGNQHVHELVNNTIAMLNSHSKRHRYTIINIDIANKTPYLTEGTAATRLF